MLNRNDNKTELMLVTSNGTKHICSIPTSFTIGNGHIPLSVCDEFGFCIRPVVIKQCAPELFPVHSVAFLKYLSRYEKQMYAKLLYYTISLRTLLVLLRHYYDSYMLLFLQLASGPQILHGCKTPNKGVCNGMLTPPLAFITGNVA